jgi:hypothetical protein
VSSKISKATCVNVGRLYGYFNLKKEAPPPHLWTWLLESELVLGSSIHELHKIDAVSAVHRIDGEFLAVMQGVNCTE